MTLCRARRTVRAVPDLGETEATSFSWRQRTSSCPQRSKSPRSSIIFRFLPPYTLVLTALTQSPTLLCHPMPFHWATGKALSSTENSLFPILFLKTPFASFCVSDCNSHMVVVLFAFHNMGPLAKGTQCTAVLGIRHMSSLLFADISRVFFFSLLSKAPFSASTCHQSGPPSAFHSCSQHSVLLHYPCSWTWKHRDHCLPFHPQSSAFLEMWIST